MNNEFHQSMFTYCFSVQIEKQPTITIANPVQMYTLADYFYNQLEAQWASVMIKMQFNLIFSTFYLVLIF